MLRLQTTGTSFTHMLAAATINIIIIIVVVVIITITGSEQVGLVTSHDTVHMNIRII